MLCELYSLHGDNVGQGTLYCSDEGTNPETVLSAVWVILASYISYNIIYIIKIISLI